MQFGMPLPDALKDPPELLPGLEFYMSAFWALCSCRSIGMSLGPIPWTAIHTYGEMYCDTEQGIRDLIYHIRHLDHKYLDWNSKKPTSPDPPKKPAK